MAKKVNLQQVGAAIGKAFALFPTLTATLARIEAAKADGKATVGEWVGIIVEALSDVGRVFLPMLPPPVQQAVSKLLLLLPILGDAVIEWEATDDPGSPGGERRTAAEYGQIIQRAGERILAVLLPAAAPGT